MLLHITRFPPTPLFSVNSATFKSLGEFILFIRCSQLWGQLIVFRRELQFIWIEEIRMNLNREHEDAFCVW